MPHVFERITKLQHNNKHIFIIPYLIQTTIQTMDASSSSSTSVPSTSTVQLLKHWKCFGGEQRRFIHTSKIIQTDMHFQIYIPPSASSTTPAPVLYCLAGLTCTDETFLWKSGAQRYAAEHGIALITPDTSPRTGNNPLQGETTSGWDFGAGAGFYLTATKEPFSKHYNMYDYIVEELPAVIAGLDLPIDLQSSSIMGHSMGGLGALNTAFKNWNRFASVSAFAPITNPSNVPWGIKAFSGYFGDSDDVKEKVWSQWDPTILVASAGTNSTANTVLPIKIDLGNADEFLHAGQVVIDSFLAAASGNSSKVKVDYALRDGYDHGYFFVQTFVGDHIAFHAKYLKEKQQQQQQQQ